MASSLIAFYDAMSRYNSRGSDGKFTTDAGTTLQDMAAQQSATSTPKREAPPMTEIVKNWAKISGTVSAVAVSAPQGEAVKPTPAVRFAMYLETLDPQARAAAEQAAKAKRAERLNRPKGHRFK